MKKLFFMPVFFGLMCILSSCSPSDSKESDEFLKEQQQSCEKLVDENKTLQEENLKLTNNNKKLREENRKLQKNCDFYEKSSREKEKLLSECHKYFSELSVSYVSLGKILEDESNDNTKNKKPGN